MGFFDKIIEFFFPSKKYQLIIVGLDNGGKTTIIRKIRTQNQKQKSITPTVGYNLQKFQKYGIKFTVFDMAGQGKYRDLWKSFIQDVDGIIFVIDSADRLRFSIAAQQLKCLLQSDQIKKNIPVLVFTNKTDLQQSAQVQQVIKFCNIIELLQTRSWKAQPTCALKGQGLQKGFLWLLSELEKLNKKS